MAVEPIESQEGGDISPVKHSPQDGQCGPRVERTDEERAEADKDMENVASIQEDHHDPEAASSGDIRHDTSSAPVVSVRDPGSASQSEIDEHDKTHLPYRSWCPVCVMAKGKEDGHF